MRLDADNQHHREIALTAAEPADIELYRQLDTLSRSNGKEIVDSLDGTLAQIIYRAPNES